MKTIKTHEFKSYIDEVYQKSLIDRISNRLNERKKSLLCHGKNAPKELVIQYVLEQRPEDIRKYMHLWVDMGVEHFNRVLTDQRIEIRLGNEYITVDPESEREKNKVDAFVWYRLFYAAYLSQYDDRMRELMAFDLSKLIVKQNDHTMLMIDYVKSLMNKDEALMAEKLLAVREMSLSDETTYHSLRGVTKINNKKYGIAEARQTMLLPIIELFDSAFHKNVTQFNEVLENYLVGKCKYITKKKTDSDWDHWIDFPALCCCAYALEQGISIEVESNYIPSWMYKRAF